MSDETVQMEENQVPESSDASESSEASSSPSRDFLDDFVLEQQKQLTSFLRKKITVHMESIEPFYPDKYVHDYEEEMVLSFQALPKNEYGIISFDFAFLHVVMTLLYGGSIAPEEPIVKKMGKFGIKIVLRVAEICLSTLEVAMQRHLATDVTFSNLSTHLYSYFNQDKAMKFLKFALLIKYETVTSKLTIVLPDSLCSVKFAEVELTHEELDLNDAVGRVMDSDLRDSIVDVCVSLSEIKLRVKDVMDLKEGDIIPIGDPESVYVTLNQTKLFKGLAGRSNLKRVVKIISKY